MRWAELTGGAAASGDLLHLAEPLSGVADVSDASVARFLEGVGDRLGNLVRCDGRPEALTSVASQRPDYILMGGAVAPADIDAIRTAMRTAALGLVLLSEDPDAWAVIGNLPPQIEVEILDTAAGPTVFALHLRALMRRCRPVALAGRRTAGGATLDEAAMLLGMGAASAPLSLEDFRLLGPLFDMPGRIWPREDLLRLAYGAQTANGLRTVDVKLNRTRRRLRALLGRDPIRSVRGEGYMLDPD